MSRSRLSSLFLEIASSYSEFLKDARSEPDIDARRRILEDSITVANHTFRQLSGKDAAWHAEVFDNAIPFDPSEERSLGDAYRRWLDPRDEVIVAIEAFEAAYGPLRGADELRRNYREVLGVLADDNEFFAGPDLAEKCDAAIDAQRSGKTTEFHEFGEPATRTFDRHGARVACPTRRPA